MKNDKVAELEKELELTRRLAESFARAFIDLARRHEPAALEEMLRKMSKV